MIHVFTSGEANLESFKLSKVTKRCKIKESINFIEKDAVGIQSTHVDATIVSLSINNQNMHHVLVDGGSAINILHYSTFSLMNLSMERVDRYGFLIQGFSSELVSLEGTITLIIKAGTRPLHTIAEMSFLMVKLLIIYNAILGCPGLCSLDAVLFPNYLTMKFPTNHRVKQLKGSRTIAQ